MSNKNILCSISTRGRYDTTLPLAIASAMNQTLLPDKLIIFEKYSFFFFKFNKYKKSQIRKKTHHLLFK